jgi:hypothetical protein
MRTHRVTQIATGISVILLAAGCSTWDSMNRTQQGTTVGASSGAVAGAVVGGPVGAVVGGVAGGAVGYTAAKSYDSGVRNSESSGNTARSSLVQSAQQSLNDKGFDAGAPDGQWGPKTEEAVRNFQSANGLQVTGQLDSQTTAALGIAQSKVAR